MKIKKEDDGDEDGEDENEDDEMVKRTIKTMLMVRTHYRLLWWVHHWYFQPVSPLALLLQWPW